MFKLELSRRWLIGALAGGIVVIAIAGILVGPSQDSPEPSSLLEPLVDIGAEAIEIREFRLVDPLLRGDNRIPATYVEGVAKVNHDCGYARVMFWLIAGSKDIAGDDRTGYAQDSEFYLRKGAIWHFDARGVAGRRPVRAEIAEVVCYPPRGAAVRSRR